MATIGTLAVNIIAHTGQFGRALGGVRAEISAVQRTVSSAARSVAGFLGIAGSFGGLGFAAKLTAEAEDAQVAFGVLLKSTADAQRLIGDLRKFAKETPLEFPEVTQAAKQLLAYGFAQDEVLGTMRQLGDVASGLGVPIGEMAYLFGTARVQGRLFAKDINQFTNRGVPIIQELAKNLGVTTEQVMKLTEEGHIGFNELAEAFRTMTASGGQFFGMMDARSKTLSGQWSKLKDTAKELAVRVGVMLRPAMEAAIRLFDMLLNALSQINPETVKLVLQVAAFVAGFVAAVKVVSFVVKTLRGLVTALRAVAAGQATVLGLSGPAGWAALAVGVAAAAGATYLIGQQFDKLDGQLSRVAESSDKFAASAQQVTAGVGAQALAARKAAEELVELQKRGDQLKESLRTPFEVYADSLKEFIQLQKAGAISWDTYGRAVKKAADDLREATKEKERFDAQLEGVGAVQRGTVAGFSAVQAANRVQAENARKQQETLVKQLAEEKQHTRLLKEIRDELAEVEGADI